jgi:ABC-type transporter Mla subunit MlaD
MAMEQTLRLVDRVARHDQAIEDIVRRQDNQDTEIDGVVAAVTALTATVNDKFDRSQSYLLGILGSVILMLLGVVLDVVLRIH